MPERNRITRDTFLSEYLETYLSIFKGEDELPHDCFYNQDHGYYHMNGNWFKQNWDGALLTGDRYLFFNKGEFDGFVKSISQYDSKYITTTLSYTMIPSAVDYGLSFVDSIQFLADEVPEKGFPPSEEEAESVMENIVFGKSETWGLLCAEEILILGGDDHFMELFYSEVGGEDQVKNRFAEGYPPWPIESSPRPNEEILEFKYNLIKSVGWDPKQLREMADDDR